MGYIYKITNTENSKIYVGKTTMTLERRFYFHTKHVSEKSGRSLISSAIKKYGKERFNIILLEEVDDSNLNEREIYWISKLNSKNPNGYNITDGGDGCSGRKMTDDYRKKLSKRMSGSGNNFYNKRHTDKAKKIIGEKGAGRVPWNKGVKMSEKSKEKLRESIKKKWANGDYKDRQIDYSDQIRLQKIINKLTGRKQAKDEIEKRRKTLINRYKRNGAHWDSNNIKLLVDNWDKFSDAELKKRFFENRTTNAIRGMRRRLGLKRR